MRQHAEAVEGALGRLALKGKQRRPYTAGAISPQLEISHRNNVRLFITREIPLSLSICGGFASNVGKYYRKSTAPSGSTANLTATAIAVSVATAIVIVPANANATAPYCSSFYFIPIDTTTFFFLHTHSDREVRVGI
jgi:hypothetical protein